MKTRENRVILQTAQQLTRQTHCLQSSLLSSPNTAINLQTFSKREPIFLLSSIEKDNFSCSAMWNSFNFLQFITGNVHYMHYEVLTRTTIKYDFRITAISLHLFVSDSSPELEIDCFKTTISLLSANVIVTFHFQQVLSLSCMTEH